MLMRELHAFGFETSQAADGRSGLQRGATEPFDIIVLDVMLPGLDGFEVCKQLRQRAVQTPVLMLTARGSEVDRVTGLEIGADDYVVKPFSVREVVARIKALVRRGLPGGGVSSLPRRTLQACGCTLDLDGRHAEVDGVTVNLSQREFDLLRVLIEGRGQVFDREHLMQAVWGRPWDALDRSVDTCVLRLRDRLGRNSQIARALVGVRGVGYRLDLDA